VSIPDPRTGKLPALVAIDPGTEKSGVVVLDANGDLHRFGLYSNEDLLWTLGVWGSRPEYKDARLAVEMVASYGMTVGREVFETVFWIGRFVERWNTHNKPWSLVYRRDIKLHLCGTARAKDSNIRQAILDMYPRTGGGKTPQVGTKPKPGPLYGIKTHLWSALAIAIYAKDHPQDQNDVS
jgi:hypothetical protein